MKKLFLTLCVISLMLPVFSPFAGGIASAEETRPIIGVYHFTSSHTTHYQIEDHFTWDESWFARSSLASDRRLL